MTMGTLALLEPTVVVTVPALAEAEPEEARVVVTVAVPEAEPEPKAATTRVNFTVTRFEECGAPRLYSP